MFSISKLCPRVHLSKYNWSDAINKHKFYQSKFIVWVVLVLEYKSAIFLS